jgi:hypothetical protein
VSGLASGSVACLTALLFTVAGMGLIAGDPVGRQEWAAQGPGSGYSGITVYWAHQSLVGSVLHLLVLGLLQGAALGALGGVIRLNRRPSKTEAEAGG